MTREEKILSLTARLDEAYEENMRIAVIEPFGLAEQIAYDALLERIEGLREYRDFLEGCHVIRNRKETHAAEAGVPR